jgi:hypothetical protein
MEQIKVSLPDDLRDYLEKVAKSDRISLSEAVRRHVEDAKTLHADPKTSDLMVAVQKLAQLVKDQTDYAWYEHPAATRILRDAIAARFERVLDGMGVGGDLTPDELPAARPVAVDDQKTWGAALEAIESYARSIGGGYARATIIHRPRITSQNRKRFEAAMKEIERAAERERELAKKKGNDDT